MKISGFTPGRVPLAELVRRRPAWPVTPGSPASGDERLVEVQSFGPNPGGLRMLRFVPPGLPPGAPLVVLLHGCTQRAGGFDLATGWSVLAERHGFALLAPEQRRENNRNLCFNWFEPPDIMRGSGEVASIRAMAAATLAELRIDPARVFVTGLSAGGAMAAALLATYPDVFSAGSVIAGLPFRAASNTSEALGAMYHCPNLAPEAWGERVRQASPTPQRKPIISIWHGDADATVSPAAAVQQARQWCNVHGLVESDGSSDAVDGALRRTWRDRSGTARVQLYSIPGLGHGAPITPSATAGDHGIGQAAPFVLHAGISSTWHIARSWGLVPPEAPPDPAHEPRPSPVAPSPLEALRQAFKF